MLHDNYISDTRFVNRPKLHKMRILPHHCQFSNDAAGACCCIAGKVKRPFTAPSLRKHAGKIALPGMPDPCSIPLIEVQWTTAELKRLFCRRNLCPKQP